MTKILVIFSLLVGLIACSTTEPKKETPTASPAARLAVFQQTRFVYVHEADESFQSDSDLNTVEIILISNEDETEAFVSDDGQVIYVRQDMIRSPEFKKLMDESIDKRLAAR